LDRVPSSTTAGRRRPLLPLDVPIVAVVVGDQHRAPEHHCARPLLLLLLLLAVVMVFAASEFCEY
jgi:hypothetical protein